MYRKIDPPDSVSVEIFKQPVAKVQWLHRDMLEANGYNPNKVAPPELQLLITSIMQDGWTQPIVVLPHRTMISEGVPLPGGKQTIVDGFHRWTVAGMEPLLSRFEGWVPTVQIGVDAIHAMMSTVRHNRARGTHGVVPMAEIVRTMAEEGVPFEVIRERLGMEEEELLRLLNRAGMAATYGDVAGKFGHAWAPTDKKQ